MPGRRKALLIGINYTGSKHQLAGCINDASNMQRYLVEDRGFSPNQSDMVMLTDTPQNRGSPFEPTGANMMAAFNWLVTGNSPGSSLFISYSGHGGTIPPMDCDTWRPNLTSLQVKSGILMEIENQGEYWKQTIS